MRLKKLFYPLGILLLVAGSVGLFMVRASFVITLIGVAGVALIFYSDQKLWLRILTVLVLPPLCVALFVVFLMAGG